MEPTDPTEAIKYLCLSAVIFFLGVMYGIYQMWKRGR